MPETPSQPVQDPNQAPDAEPVGAGGVTPSPAGEPLGDTAGTGTIIALGCITGTIFIIILGLIYLLITQLLG